MIQVLSGAGEARTRSPGLEYPSLIHVYLYMDSCPALNWPHALPRGCFVLNLTPKPDPAHSCWASGWPAQEAPLAVLRLSPDPFLGATLGCPGGSWVPLSTCCNGAPAAPQWPFIVLRKVGKKVPSVQGGFLSWGWGAGGLQRTKELLSQSALLAFLCSFMKRII